MRRCLTRLLPTHSPLHSRELHLTARMSTDSREAKKALRKEMKTRLSTLSESAIAMQSTLAQQLILSLPQYRIARRIGIYLSMPTAEARTDILVRDALTSGKKAYIPYIHSVPNSESKTGRSKVMEMLRLASLSEYEGLGRDSWGIPHLHTDGIEGRENAMGGTTRTVDAEDEDVCVCGLDLIVVPGVAFDTEMGRLGHGAGFYDRYLTRFCADGKRRKPFLVGLCLAEQMVEKGRIEMVEEWDWRIDVVAVGDGRIVARGG